MTYVTIMVAMQQEVDFSFSTASTMWLKLRCGHTKIFKTIGL